MCPEQYQTIPGKSMPGSMMLVRGGMSEEAEVTEGGSTAKLRQGLSLEIGRCVLQLEVLNEQANLQKVFSNLELGPLIINWAYSLLPGWGSKAYFHLSRRKEIWLRNRLCVGKKKSRGFISLQARCNPKVRFYARHSSHNPICTPLWLAQHMWRPRGQKTTLHGEYQAASEDGEGQVKGWDICQRGQGLWVRESHDGIWGGPSPGGEEKAPDSNSGHVRGRRHCSPWIRPEFLCP